MYVFEKYRFLLKNTGLWASKYRFVFPEVGMSGYGGVDQKAKKVRGGRLLLTKLLLNLKIYHSNTEYHT